MMKISWFTTSPNPSPHAYSGGPDQGQRGWKLHAVIDPQFDVDPSVWNLHGPKRSRTKALCGLRPRHGWGIDMFIEEECERCNAIVEKMESSIAAAEGEKS